MATYVGNYNFVQDETGAAYLGQIANPGTWSEGDRVEFRGVTAGGGFNPIVEHATIRVLSSGNPMPEPKRISMRQLASGMNDGLWVEIEGVVQAIQEQPDRWELDLASQGVARRVTFRKTPGSFFIKNLLDKEIEIQGVAIITSRRNQTNIGTRLICPNVRHLKVRYANEDLSPAWLPADIGSVRTMTQTNVAPHWIRVMGQVSDIESPGNYVIVHGLSTMRVEKSPADLSRPRVGQWVEIYGFPYLLNGELHLRGATMQEIGVRRAFATRPIDPLAPLDHEFSKTLYSIKEIRQLPAAEVSNGYPVRISGVVTLANSNQWLFFVQDYSGSLFVFNTQWPPGPYKTGTRVEIRGFVEPGMLAPVISEPKIAYLGEGPPPIATRATIQSLQSDQFDSQWVSVSGMVRSVDVYETNQAKIELSDASRTLSVIVFDVGNREQLESLAGKRVQLTGVCGGVSSKEKEFLYSRLILPGPSFITTTDTSQVNAFGLSIAPIENAVELALSGSPRDIHIQGAVLGDWLEKSRRRIFIRDSTGSMTLITTASTQVKPGTRIEATGFPDVEDGEPVIRRAQIRHIGLLAPQQPQILTSFKEISKRTISPTLVEVDATLLFSKPEGDGLYLIFQIKDELFEARLHTLSDQLKRLIPGGLFRIKGILLGKGNSLEFFERCLVLIRTPDDLVLLTPPTWWNSTRITIVISTAALVFLTVVLWMLALRRQVREQTEIIRRELETEAALERRYHMIWDISADAMCMCDSQGTIVQVNEAYCRMVGKKPLDLIGHSFSVIHVPENQEIIRNLYVKDFASRIIPRHVSQEWVLWNGRRGCFDMANSFLEEAGSPPMLLSLIREVTEQKHLEEQLRTSQKMEAIGRLAGGVAHDFNNILTVIQGYTGMLKGDDRIPVDDRELLEEVDKSAQRAADLTRQLLAFSRRQPLMAQLVDLSELVRNMLRLLARLLGEDIKIDFQPAPVAGRVRVDVGKMEQVLMNLTVNARDAMPKGGLLRITVEQVTVTESQVEENSEHRPGEFICLMVQDTGCGMDESTLARIFEPFFTTKDVGKGTGLGLSTAYGIVKQHSGWIDVSSQVGKGTTFRVYIPVQQDTEEESGFGRSVLAGKSSGLILVVEDEPTVRHFVRFFLQRQGYSVLVASQGSEGLALWNQNTDAISLVLTDLVMPGDPSGRELGRRIEKERPNVPVIYSSGYSLETFPEKEGFVEDYNYLPKPYDSVRLAKVVNERLKEVRKGTKPATN